MKNWLVALIGALAILGLVENVYAQAVVPEIDASGAAPALSLLAGVVALAAERLRRK